MVNNNDKPMNIKIIKKELSITDKDIAGFFGYKNKESYYHAARRKDIEQGIVNIYRLFNSRNVAEAEKRKGNTRSDKTKNQPQT